MCVYFRVVYTCGHRRWQKACYKDWGNCECRLTHPRHHANDACDRCDAQCTAGSFPTINSEAEAQPEGSLQKCAAWLISVSHDNEVTATVAEYQRPSADRSIFEIYMETLRSARQTARRKGELADDSDDSSEWSWHTSHTLSEAGINGDSDLDSEDNNSSATLGHSGGGAEDNQTGTDEGSDRQAGGHGISP